MAAIAVMASYQRNGIALAVAKRRINKQRGSINVTAFLSYQQWRMANASSVAASYQAWRREEQMAPMACSGRRSNKQRGAKRKSNSVSRGVKWRNNRSSGSIVAAWQLAWQHRENYVEGA